eukprot:403342623
MKAMDKKVWEAIMKQNLEKKQFQRKDLIQQKQSILEIQKESNIIDGKEIDQKNEQIYLSFLDGKLDDFTNMKDSIGINDLDQRKAQFILKLQSKFSQQSPQKLTPQNESTFRQHLSPNKILDLQEEKIMPSSHNFEVQQESNISGKLSSHLSPLSDKYSRNKVSPLKDRRSNDKSSEIFYPSNLENKENNQLQINSYTSKPLQEPDEDEEITASYSFRQFDISSTMQDNCEISNIKNQSQQNVSRNVLQQHVSTPRYLIEDHEDKDQNLKYDKENINIESNQIQSIMNPKQKKRSKSRTHNVIDCSQN